MTEQTYRRFIKIDEHPLYGCVREIEWLPSRRSGHTAAVEEHVRTHAVWLEPPVDHLTICGWRYDPIGLDLQRAWLTTQWIERCRDCADILGVPGNSR